MNLTVLLISNGNRDLSIHCIDVKKDGCTANSDHGGRRCDLHVTRFGNLAGDETGGALDESEQRMVRATRQTD
ncbi:hypothetical protein LRP30_09510 [Bradyrhizobium sp. C-145]|uniref:Uncharacterized protein n=1 Tax=Bradyrhizobium zhanjiangense TaxID=1325107 RepID=A0A4Q0SUL1_9BRAD|nr:MULTISPECIES: hypothetical protein [Bradyrhizobium]RXH41901.1 hypothetical protein XH94_04380 [Bradyrhizobium zhanjiangense]UQR65452.1 hypothetical protein LRP30_09510 [Bradyrhizobium sp. C-145]